MRHRFLHFLTALSCCYAPALVKSQTAQDDDTLVAKFALSLQPGNTESLFRLIEECPEVVAARYDGKTSLHRLSTRRPDPTGPHHALSSEVQKVIDTVKLLSEGGALLEALNEEGETPLMCAVRSKKWYLVAALLEVGADPDAACYCRCKQEAEKWYCTPLLAAIALQEIASFACLLQYGANPSLACGQWATPLRYLGDQYERHYNKKDYRRHREGATMLNTLLDVPNKRYLKPLLRTAVAGGNGHWLSLILALAAARQQPVCPNSLFELACWLSDENANHSHTEVFAQLVDAMLASGAKLMAQEAGKDTTNYAYKLCLFCIQKGRPSNALIALKQGSSSLKATDLDALLSAAFGGYKQNYYAQEKLAAGFFGLVEGLLDHGANPNGPLLAAKEEPAPPLLLTEALRYGLKSLVALLLEFGADPNYGEEQYGTATPLYFLLCPSAGEWLGDTKARRVVATELLDMMLAARPRFTNEFAEQFSRCLLELQAWWAEQLIAHDKAVAREKAKWEASKAASPLPDELLSLVASYLPISTSPQPFATNLRAWYAMRVEEEMRRVAKRSLCYRWCCCC